MLNWLIDFLSVFVLSKKMQWTLILGIILHFSITLLGENMVANFELYGSMKELGEVFANKFMRKYDKFASFVLIASWVLAIKFYIKDRSMLN